MTRNLTQRTRRHRSLPFVVGSILVAGPASGADVRIHAVFDEAEAALVIMHRLHVEKPLTDAHWQALWQSEGYRRLLEREASMGRDEGFGDKLAAWLRDPETHGRHAEMRAAVDRYRSFEVDSAGARAAAYLPDGVVLQTTFYPVLKHTQNTFVYDLSGEPAIFMSVDPGNSARFVQAVLTHELHHVGYAQCPKIADSANLSQAQQWVVDRLGIFGEGIAVLATAGGPSRHPHFYSTPREWAVWERDAVRVAADLARMEDFFGRVLDGTVPEEDRRKVLFSFIATPDVPQGPAYTLGWKMAATVERRYGRAVLIDAMCDPRELMRLYNRAADELQAGDYRLPRWSEEFMRRLEPPESGGDGGSR